MRTTQNRSQAQEWKPQCRGHRIMWSKRHASRRPSSRPVHAQTPAATATGERACEVQTTGPLPSRGLLTLARYFQTSAPQRADGWTFEQTPAPRADLWSEVRTNVWLHGIHVADAPLTAHTRPLPRAIYVQRWAFKWLVKASPRGGSTQRIRALAADSWEP